MEINKYIYIIENNFNILCLINNEYQVNMKSSDEYTEINSIKQLNSNNIFQI